MLRKRNPAKAALSIALLMISCGWLPSSMAGSPAVLKSEFVFEQAPFRSCHASTVVETKTGLVTAWFGGSDEGNADVTIWVSRHDGKHWSPPVEVADGRTETGKRYPCWNPVLFQVDRGPLLLFYKVGPNPREWWGSLQTSTDGGATWSKPQRLPDGILGPIKNKPIMLDSGELLCPSSTEHAGWRVHMERTPDLGKTWSKTEPLNKGDDLSAIQPTILQYAGQMQILCRTRQDAIYESWSSDNGRTWSPLRPTKLPNPNSGIDAVNLKDGRALLVYNHTPDGRSPLNVAVSNDGKLWQAALELETEPGEYSYPAVIRTADDRIHVTYTWKREKVKHVVLDPERLELQEMPEGRWPGKER